MRTFLDNPRRAPRLPIALEARVTHAGGTADALTADFSTGGCLLVLAQPLPEGARLSLEIRSDAIPDVLQVNASVAWQAGTRCGIRFGPTLRGARPDVWFQRLLERRPHLQEMARQMAARTPARISVHGHVVRASSPIDPRSMTPDEERVLAHVRERITIEELIGVARMPPHYFARAVFALLEKGLLVAEPVRPTLVGGTARVVRR